MTRRVDISRMEVVDEAVAQVLRRKTPAQRVAMMFSCNRTMRSLIEAGVVRQNPDWDDAAVNREVARRMLLGAT